MLGNELNPESGAAARLQEQLTAELAAHAAGTSGGDMLIPPPLINKAQSVTYDHHLFNLKSDIAYFVDHTVGCDSESLHCPAPPNI